MLINDCVFFLKCIYTENLNKTVQQWRGTTAKETTHQESGWQWDVFEFQWLFNVNVVVLYLCSTVFLFRILWSQSSMTYFNICLVRYHRRFLCVCVCSPSEGVLQWPHIHNHPHCCGSNRKRSDQFSSWQTWHQRWTHADPPQLSWW